VAELVVATPDGRELTLYEADFIEGLVLQAAVAVENARNHRRNVKFASVQQNLDAARHPTASVTAESTFDPRLLAGLSLRHLLRGGRRLSRHRCPAGREPADGGGQRSRQEDASAIVSVSFRSAFRAMATGGPPLDELAARMSQHH
jgi:GAF domain-containing protein